MFFGRLALSVVKVTLGLPIFLNIINSQLLMSMKGSIFMDRIDEKKCTNKVIVALDGDLSFGETKYGHQNLQGQKMWAGLTDNTRLRKRCEQSMSHEALYLKNALKTAAVKHWTWVLPTHFRNNQKLG